MRGVDQVQADSLARGRKPEHACSTSGSSDPGSPLSPALLATIILLVAASFAAGVLAFGLNRGESRPMPGSASAPAGGCHERPLAYGLSDDRSLQGRLAVVERVPIPRAGFYTPGTAPSTDELLHAGVHGFAVIRYRASHQAVGALRRLVARKLPSFAVIAVPGEPARAPLSATVWGRELSCRALSPHGLRALERFVDALHGVR